MYNEELKIMKKLAIKAGKAILEIYNKDYSIEYKEDNSPITLADKKANDIIVDGLKNHFPSYGFLSEESKDEPSRLKKEYCFIIDPLDGTKEFIHKTGEFTVNIALSYNNKVIIGVIYVPTMKELFYGSINNGAYLTINNSTIKLQVSKKDKNLTMVSSKSHKTKENILKKNFSSIITKEIAKGSSLKGCLVAKGEADIYYRYGYTCEWDTAAMQCIVEEAGGTVVQLDGTKLLYNKKNTLNSKGFCVVNIKKNIWI